MFRDFMMAVSVLTPKLSKYRYETILETDLLPCVPDESSLG